MAPAYSLSLSRSGAAACAHCAGLSTAARGNCPKDYEAPNFEQVNRQFSRWYDAKVQDSYCRAFRNVCMDQDRFVVYNKARFGADELQLVGPNSVGPSN